MKGIRFWRIVLALALLSGLLSAPFAVHRVPPAQAQGSRAVNATDAWYFKAGNWIDYAPSGLPDFDQKQDNWGHMGSLGWQWTYCGPVAAANSLWWFDSKFETAPLTPTATLNNDHYPLVQSYSAWDDHWISNPFPLVDDLANYCGTSPVTGTNVYDMYYGLQRYLYDHGLYDDYLVTLAISPTFDWVTQEVMRSEDVILLLGFYEESGPGIWHRVGGHYVTVAGVNPNSLGIPQIAFSDPFRDNAEAGRPGRILSGTLVAHNPGHGSDVHNDAGNVSHDFYPVIPTSSPGGVWGPGDYVLDPAQIMNFFGQNPHPNIPTMPWGGTPLFQTEVEFAIAVSPFTWKPGEWADYAPSCMPDFGQKQDGWNSGPQWTHCGPVAVANSLWWFDSRFEPSPVPPPAYNDNYPLVQTYATMLPSWDDHDPLNVETQGATFEFVDDLAKYMKTGVTAPGTIITDMVSGTIQYLTDHGLYDDYTVTLVHQPEWDWVVHEVTRCENVVLLLGFWWYNMGDGMWYRYGGHYVTVAGVDPVGKLVGFSDPFFDQAELGWPWLGRVYPPGVPHPHPPMPPDPAHNDAAFLSHDVYRAAASPSPGGKWGPDGYPAGLALSNFEGLNGPSGDPVPGSPPPDPSIIYTEVEWAMAVSPKDPDLVITKDVTPTLPVSPGDWITYTIHYSNPTSNWATAVVITDEIPTYLVPGTVTFTYTTDHGVITATDTYFWEVGTLKYQQGGVITVTGQVDPAITAGSLTFTNTAVITATADRDPANNSDSVAVTVLQPVLRIAKTDAPDPVRAGGAITYTITVQNTGGANATNATITDTLPAGVTFAWADSGGSRVGNQVRWTGKTVNAGGSLVVHFGVTVPLTTTLTTITNAAYGATCAEGASATGSPVTTSVTAYRLYLPLVMKSY